MGGINILTAYPQRGVWFCSAVLFSRFWTLQPHGGGGGNDRRRLEAARELGEKCQNGIWFVLLRGVGVHVQGGENACLNRVWQASLQMVLMRRGTTLVPHTYYGFGRVLQCRLPFTGRNHGHSAVTSSCVIQRKQARACVEISPPLRKHPRLLPCFLFRAIQML